MSALSDKALALSVQYLGPAAQIFLERQTKHHLDGLTLDALEPRHLPELAKWVNISAALLIDPAQAKELSQKISTLG